MSLVRRLAVLLLMLTLAWPVVGAVRAEEPAWFADATQTTLYLGLKTHDGKGVSEQAWASFLADVVTPRFPDGLTVVSAYGQAGSDLTDEPGTIVEMTKMLIIVRPDTPEAAKRIEEIKAEFRRLYSPTGVFHTETPTRVIP